MNQPAGKTIEIGDFEFDPARGILRRDGITVRLSASAGSVLAALTASSDHTIRLDDAATAAGLSPGQVTSAASELSGQLGNFFRFDASSQTLALADGGSLYSFLEELRNRKVFRVAAGYAVSGWLLLQIAEIVFPIIELGGAAMRILLASIVLGFPVAIALAWALELTPAGLVIDWRRTRPGKAIELDERKLDRFIIAVLILVIALLVLRNWTANIVEAPGTQVVAVMPFTSTSMVEGGTNLCDGFAEEIRVGLDRLPGLQVASRELSAALDQPERNANVRWLISGSCQQVEDALKVQVTLTENESGRQHWAYSDSRGLDELLTFQDDVAATLAFKLAVPGEALQATVDAKTSNPRAYRFYIEARGYLSRPHQSGSIATAAELFGNAIREDEEFAAAHAGLCEASLVQYLRSHDTSLERQAESACLRASQLGPGLPEVHIALGRLFLETGDHGTAERALVKALEIKPGSVAATRQLANVFTAQRKWAQAETLFREAIAIPAGSWRANSDYGRYLLRRQRFEEATQQFREVVALTPDNAPAHNNLGATYLQMGKLEDAAASFARVAEIEPVPSAISNYGTMLYYTGKFEQAERQFRRAADMWPEDHRLRGNVGDALYQIPERRNDSISEYRKAAELAQARLEVSRKDAQALAAQGLYRARIGEHENITGLIDEALLLAPEDPEVSYFAALVKLATDEQDAAFDHLVRAAEAGYPRFLLQASPDLRPLADRADFRALIGADTG